VKRILVFAIVVCFANIGRAQAPSATWKPPSYATPVTDDQLQPHVDATLQLQLATLSTRLVQNARDMSEMAGPFSRDCEMRATLMEISDQASVASSYLSAAFDMLEMYSLISTSNDRVAAGKVLTKHVAEAKRSLETPIKLVNLELSTPSLPAGVAVTATRIKDDIRSAIELLDEVKPQ
jgi:hypothetical protein